MDVWPQGRAIGQTGELFARTQLKLHVEDLKIGQSILRNISQFLKASTAVVLSAGPANGAQRLEGAARTACEHNHACLSTFVGAGADMGSHTATPLSCLQQYAGTANCLLGQAPNHLQLEGWSP